MALNNIEKTYRDKLVAYYNHITLTGLPERQNDLHRVPLDKVFVKLNTEIAQAGRLDGATLRERRRLEEELYRLESDGAGRRQMDALQSQLMRLETEARRPQTVTLSVAEALHKHRRLVIVGGPGSGKTTLSRWLALIFAQRRQSHADALGPDFAQDRLPILLELRRFATFFESEFHKPAVPDLTTVIANYISSNPAIYGEIPGQLIQDALTEGHCLLILDGVDEIANLGARQELTEAINAFLRQPNSNQRDNLMLITSRPHGYREVGLGHDFQSCEVKPFSDEDVALFIRHWYATAYHDIEYETEAEILIEAIQSKEQVTALATNPLLCTIIAIVYRNNRVLPNRRVELYLKCCEALLDTWERNKNIKESGLIGNYDWQTKLELLTPLAYHLYQNQERTAAPEADLVTQLAADLEARHLAHSATEAQQEARRFITAIRDRSGILQGRGDGMLEFAHRTFQEYLAARYIAVQPDPDYIDLVMIHLHEEWWREVHLLVIGYLGASQDNAEKVSKLLLTILNLYRPPWRIWRTSSVLSSVPSWMRHLVQRIENNLIFKQIILMIGSIFISSTIFHRFLASKLSKVHLESRFAWVLQREFELTMEGYSDCLSIGITEIFQQMARKKAEYLLLSIIYDQGRQEETQLLIKACATILKNRPNDDLLKILIDTLDGSDMFAERTVIFSFREIGRADEKIINMLIDRLGHSDTLVIESALSSLTVLSQINEEVVNVLADSLQDDKKTVKRNAAFLLGEICQVDNQVIDNLIDALGDSDRSIRQVAASSLGKLGQASEKVVKALMELLNDNDVSVKLSAASSLVDLGQYSDKLINALMVTLGENYYDIRETASSSLAKLSQIDKEVVNVLVAALNDNNIFVKESAASLLGELGQNNKKVVIALINVLDDSAWYVRKSAASSLAKLGQTNEEIFLVLVKTLSDKNIFVREAVAISLAQSNQNYREIVVDTLIDTIKDSEWIVRKAVVSSLGELGQASEKVVKVLVNALGDNEWYVRLAAAPALIKLGQANEEVAHALMDGLYDDDVLVKKNAADSLGRLGQLTKEDINALVNVLGDGDNDRFVRESVASVLGNLREVDSQVTQALVSTLGDSSKYVRIASTSSLVKLSYINKIVIETLVDTLNNSNISVKLAAISLLGDLDRSSSSKAGKALVNVLADDCRFARYAAASSLGKLGVKELDEALWHQIIVALNQRLHDFDDNVRRAALEAIRSLVDGRPLPGYRWKPIGERQARQKRRRQVGKWLGIVAMLLLVGAVVTLLADYVDPDNFWFRLAGTVGVLIGVLAGVAQVLGRDMRDMWD